MVVALLSRKHVVAHLQAAAKAADGINNKEEIKRWASQSIQVGACALLSEGGHYGTFVKIFLLCLRNIACMTVQHSATISWYRSLGVAFLFSPHFPLVGIWTASCNLQHRSLQRCTTGTWIGRMDGRHYILAWHCDFLVSIHTLSLCPNCPCDLALSSESESRWSVKVF